MGDGERGYAPGRLRVVSDDPSGQCPLPAICTNIFLATGIPVAPGPRPGLMPCTRTHGRWAAAMTVSISEAGEELMTRQQVAYLFRDTSAAVAKWARRGLLPEVRNGAGRPRYRRADVEDLLRSGFRQKPR